MRRRTPTPAFDRLCDCARELDGGELVLELRTSVDAAGEELWLVLRTLDGARCVHEVRVEETVDAAAEAMIEAAESGAAKRDA